MNLFTKFLLLKLKHNLTNRNLYRKGWGNWLKITKHSIIKVSHTRVKFEHQLISYLVGYYKKVLHLDFQYYEDENPELFYVESPFVNLSISAYFHSKEYISSKTNEILTNFANTSECVLNFIKKNNPNVDHFEVKCADLHPTNFFKYKKEFYLLDMEDFYFLMYNKKNQLIHVTDLSKDSQKHVIKYKDRVKYKQSRKEKQSRIEEYKYIFI